MYELKEVTLKNKHYEKKRLVINFYNPQYNILAEFLMSDACLLSEEISRAFKLVSSGEKVELSGNRCHVEIKQTETCIYDLFSDNESISYPSLKLTTEEFKQYINIWKEALIQFNDQ